MSPLTVTQREESMHSKSLFRALGLSLMAVLGLLAFGVSSASAEDLTRANHLHAPIKVGNSEHLLANFTGTGGLGQLLAIPLGIEIHCKKSSLNEGKILQGLKESGGTKARALAVVTFEECNVYEWNGTTLGGLLPCTITDKEKTGPNNITAKAILLPVTHKINGTESRLYVVAEPDVAGQELNPSSIFTTIFYKSGTGCALPLTQNITGSYTFEVTQGQAVELELKAGLKALQTLMGTGLFYGLTEAELHGGDAKGKLIGDTHVGLEWGIV